MDILILAAMKEEVAYLEDLLFKNCESYAAKRKGEKLCKETFTLKRKEDQDDITKVTIIITGVGILNTLLTMVTYGGESYNYDVIINLGTAGAKGSYRIGDIVCVNKCYNSDFDLTAFGYDKFEIPELGKFLYTGGEGFGVCVSGSKFVTDSKYLEGLREDSCVIDMELYGILAFFKTIGIPNVRSYKIVTDVLDSGNSKDSHEETLSELSRKLCSYVYNLYIA